MSTCDRCGSELPPKYSQGQSVIRIRSPVWQSHTMWSRVICLVSVLASVGLGQHANGANDIEFGERQLLPDYEKICQFNICDLRKQYCDENVYDCASCEAECSREVLDRIRPAFDRAPKEEWCRREDICGPYYSYISINARSQGTPTTPVQVSTPTVVINEDSVLQESGQGDSSLSNWAIVGIVALAVGIPGIICGTLIIILVYRRNRSKRVRDPEHGSPESIPLSPMDAPPSQDGGAQGSPASPGTEALGTHGCQESQAPQPTPQGSVIQKETKMPRPEEEEFANVRDPTSDPDQTLRKE